MKSDQVQKFRLRELAAESFAQTRTAIQARTDRAR
jgi:hypothetical protein